VKDDISGEEFLIDTGAEVSVLPLRFQVGQSCEPAPVLRAANGTMIKTRGCNKRLDPDWRRTL
jgi:hypothetical protein